MRRNFASSLNYDVIRAGKRFKTSNCVIMTHFFKTFYSPRGAKSQRQCLHKPQGFWKENCGLVDQTAERTWTSMQRCPLLVQTGRQSVRPRAAQLHTNRTLRQHRGGTACGRQPHSSCTTGLSLSLSVASGDREEEKTEEKGEPKLSLAAAATSIFFVATKVLSRQTRVYCDETRLLSRQKYACRDKHIFVATNVIFVATKVLWRQAYFRRDKNDTCGSTRR